MDAVMNIAVNNEVIFLRLQARDMAEVRCKEGIC